VGGAIVHKGKAELKKVDVFDSFDEDGGAELLGTVG
jgi:hypothetical protein